MTTARQPRWARLPMEFGSIPDNNDLAVVARLTVFMRRRWVEHDLDVDEAGEVRISVRELMSVTGAGRSDTALARIRAAGRSVGYQVELDRGGDVESTCDPRESHVRPTWRPREHHVVLIRWPKFAEFQGLGTRSRDQKRIEEKRKESLPSGEREPPAHGSPAEILSNLLSKEPGSREEKIAFCDRHLPVWKAQAEAEGLEGKRLHARIRELAIRWWRQERRSPGGPRSISSSQQKAREPFEERVARIVRGEF